MTPLGIRNNNPGNIRPNPNFTWHGQNGENEGFCTFDTAEHGIRAMAKLLYNYYTVDGCKTIREYIQRWAPPVENNTNAYVADVCAHCNVKPDDTYSLDNIFNLRDLVTAIITHENGECPYTGSERLEACDNAMG